MSMADEETTVAYGLVWQRDRVLDDWERSMMYALHVITGGRNKARVTFLEDELLALVKHTDLNLSQIMDVFKLFTLTYPRYSDLASRRAVEAVEMELIKKDELRGLSTKLGVADKIVEWLSNEVGLLAKRSSSSSLASSNLFVLLSWSCGVYVTCVNFNPEFASTKTWRSILDLLASLLHMLSGSDNAKTSVVKGALVRVRRALRSKEDKVVDVLQTLTSLAKSSQSQEQLRILPLIGVTCAVLVRLKHVNVEPAARLPEDIKNEILTCYAANTFLSKIPVPIHVTAALADFVNIYVTEADLSETFLSSIDKALLRTPEISLPVLTSFFSYYAHHPLPGPILERLFTQIINSAKSSNPQVRTASILAFKSLIPDTNVHNSAVLSSVIKLATSSLLTLPKSGKTAGPDHRIALYSMLGLLPVTLPLSTYAEVSLSIIQNVTPLLTKETHEGAAAVLITGVLPKHLIALLAENVTIPKETTALIAKEMGNMKPVLRRAYCGLVGNVFVGVAKDNQLTESSLDFANSLLAPLEGSLKTVATSPLNASGGLLEGYVAIVVLLAVLLKTGKFDDTIMKNPVLSSLVSTGAGKPSFLLWDKAYQKLSDSTEVMWFLRACEAVLWHYRADFEKSENLRIQLGIAFVHFSVDGSSLDIRKEVNSLISRLALQMPELVNRVLRDGLNAFLARGGASVVTKPAGNDEQPVEWMKHSRLSSLLSSSLSLHEEVDNHVRELLVVEIVILAHHPAVCGTSRQTWIDISQKARADPRELTDRHLDRLVELILGASTITSNGFAEASYTAVWTLAFVSPVTVLPRVIDQLRLDLDPTVIGALTETDLGIFGTPEGITYVDVLASEKNKPTITKGKDAALAKWDAEVRQSVASKKGADGNKAVTLTKQQQALVNAQLAEEAKVRQRVAGVKANLERGLHFVRSLIVSSTEEFRAMISEVGKLLLNGVLGRLAGVFLVGEATVETYLELSSCCSERLDTEKRWIGIATLRSFDVTVIPEELQAEPLNSLVTRILYRLRFLSEQAPFDAATFSYVYSLIDKVLTSGGIVATEEEERFEQVALAVGILDFHCGEFSNPAFPRIPAIEVLIHTVRQQPRLGKEASSALVALGQAIQSNASPSEVCALLKGTLSQEVYARNSCLQTLQPFDLTDLDWSLELLIACHDEDEQNARLARHLWDDNGLDIPEAFIDPLLDYLGHDNAYVRLGATGAIAEGVEHWPSVIQKTMLTLQALYREKAKILAPEFDQYGMVLAHTVDRSDPWPTRLAIARTSELLAPLLSANEVEPFFEFLIQDQALGDRAADVRRGMLAAGTSIIDLHGSQHLAPLIAIFEDNLSRPSSATETDDHIKEAVIILFGRVARHLDASDPRLPNIIDRLVEALKTPSEQIQIAVSDCLAPLVKLMRPKLSELVDKLMDGLLNSTKYGTRRGAAYGLAGVLKGTGIAGMKEFNIIMRLKAATEEKTRYESRQGVMLVFETLSVTLGRLFEPYITYVLPLLLASFGDGTPDVREATQDAARVIMGNMSGYGVKLILPSLLEGLDEKQWRTKKGSIELLGMMAYCSPRQLSLSLPIVIPRLTSVLTDSHAQVRTAANKSLKQFGEVISNPEIQSLVPVLLKALVDPAKTPNALSSLLKTSFMHYIDHSSLALVIPILGRGLRERGAETKKKAVQIVGNLASLTDSKDFVPYLSELMPLVHMVLVDPVPEARATAAKALGTLVERLGETHFPDLVPGLLRTLKTDTSGVDRQGAAQGLSEVLSGLGMERLEALLPDIIANAQSPRATVREGFMSLLVYLPATFGTRFQPHLPKIINPILNGLSDVEEYVREAAMRAGRMVITNYSTRAIDLLLPELERGMFDPAWRIRQASVTLVGELLFKVSGISGKPSDADEEEDAVAEAAAAELSKRALVEVLGTGRRDRILAALYLIRQDGVAVVRQTSIQIWKALVSNTPRTVRELLPELFDQIVFLVSGGEFEQQEIATRTTTEVCRKFGEKILGEILPIVKDKSTSSDARTREGVCVTLSDIMESTTESQREGHEDDIVLVVRAALVDDEANVRSAAAKAFDVLQKHFGAAAIDQTIPTLLAALRQPGKGSGMAIHALREVMSIRSSTVFPVLIPTLTAIPMTAFNCRALSSLVTVAGNALSRRLNVIMGSIVQTLEDRPDNELMEALDEALRAIFRSIEDAEGLNTLMLLLIGWAKNESPKRRASACDFFAIFCAESQEDLSLYRVDWIRQLVSLLEDAQVEVHTAAWSAFDIFVKSIPKDELEPLVVPLRRSIESTGGPGQTVPGFSLAKGVSPTIPIIIAGLTTGSNEQREQAAYAIGDLVERTEESAIKPFVVPFTGPLIRVATQATTYPPGVKTAILSALTTMLERIPAFVKPFFPQLQRTFVKSASDPASTTVRSKAAQALGVLMRHQSRVDPVITELIAGIKANDENVGSGLVTALACVVKNAFQNMGEKAKESCLEVISEAFRDSPEESYCQAIGVLVASFSHTPELLRPIVQENLVSGTSQSLVSAYVILAALTADEDGVVAEYNLFQKLSCLRDVAQKVKESIGNDRPSISRPSREARELLRMLENESIEGIF